MTGGVFRDPIHGVRARRDAEIERRAGQLFSLRLGDSQILSRRASRAATGLVGTAAGVALLLCASFSIVVTDAPARPHFGGIWWIVASVLAAGVLAALVAAWLANRAFDAHMDSVFRASRDPHRDLEGLAHGPAGHLAAFARRLDGWSIGLPLTAVATLVPWLVLVYVHDVVWPARAEMVHVLDASLWHTDAPEDPWLTRVGITFAVIATSLCLAAIVGALARRSRNGTRWMLAFFESPVSVALALLTGAVALSQLGRKVHGPLDETTANILAVTTEEYLVMSVGLTVSVLLVVGAIVARLRNTEQRRLAILRATS